MAPARLRVFLLRYPIVSAQAFEQYSLSPRVRYLPLAPFLGLSGAVPSSKVTIWLQSVALHHRSISGSKM